MENKFIVKTEDVREFLKEQMNFDWDGYTYTCFVDKKNHRKTAMDRQVANFVDITGNPKKRVYLVVDKKDGHLNFYSLIVDGFNYFNFYQFDDEGFPVSLNEENYTKKWNEFLTKKYGEDFINEVIKYHQNKLNQFIETRNNLIKNINRLDEQISEEQKLLEQAKDLNISL